MRAVLTGLLTALAGFAVVAPAHAAGRWDQLLAPARACKHATKVDAPVATQERAMRCLINWARHKRGLNRLQPSRTLDRSAAIKTRQLLRCQRFEHAPCKGIDAFDPFRDVGYADDRIAWMAGENLAWGTGPLRTPRQIMRAWLHSRRHRHNILRTQWREQGIDLRVGRFMGERRASVWASHFGVHP